MAADGHAKTRMTDANFADCRESERRTSNYPGQTEGDGLRGAEQTNFAREGVFPLSLAEAIAN